MADHTIALADTCIFNNDFGVEEMDVDEDQADTPGSDQLTGATGGNSEIFAIFDLFDEEDDDVSGNTLEKIEVNGNTPAETKILDRKSKQEKSVDPKMAHRHMKVPWSINNKNVEFTGPTPDDDDYCAICMDSHREPKTLKKCSHSFCTECIEEHFKTKPTCPVCFAPYGVITGNMPPGYMSDCISNIKLPGYEAYNTIVVSYSFCDGIQTSEHPHPGEMYYGTSRTAYLPNNVEGQKVLRLLKVAYDRKLTFTVGRSRTTGCDNVVTWNDIHHKTATSGGQENFGYPDPTYLSRVQEELAAKGVTEDDTRSSMVIES